MASSTREIKRRIKSVQNTKQITRAMEMVAAAKLRRAEQRVKDNRPYIHHLSQFIGRVLAFSPPIRHPLLWESEENIAPKKGYLVITSDRGLCGGYNSNLLRRLTQDIEDPSASNIMVLGRRGRDYFKRFGYPITYEQIYLADYPAWEDIREIGVQMLQMFEEGVFGELYLVYNEFINALQQRQIITRLLPMMPPDEDELPEFDETLYFSYEPGAEEVLDGLLPRYIYSSIYAAVLEAKASEFGARMSAMNAANNNADDMIEELTRTYNQARQAAITQELLEIVNSAEALRQSE